MIVGSKYKFNELDIKVLKTKFQDIKFISSDSKTLRELRKEIEGILKDEIYKFIVININAKLDSKTIKYLTILQFRLNQANIKITTIEKFLEKFLQKCYIPNSDDEPNLLINIEPYNKFEFFLKRIIDYVGASMLFLIHFFMKFYVKKRIDKESPGDIYFIQKRVGGGLDNIEFECIKYRSMIVDAEKNGAQFAKDNDERVFAFGNFMRKTRIDEIPQCINVLKGQMHLVGPRPERKYWINRFEKEIPYYNERHIVRPGITGWAQVNYPYGQNSYDAKQKLMYDLYYIKHWSLWLEIKIIVKTILVIFGKKGL